MKILYFQVISVQTQHKKFVYKQCKFGNLTECPFLKEVCMFLKLLSRLRLKMKLDTWILF